MKEHISEKRFKTAGARILRSRKLPKDFFNNNQRNLKSCESTHSQKNQSCDSKDKSKFEEDEKDKEYPNIFQFTFMAKQSTSLRKTKSGVFFPTKQNILPPLLRRTLLQKDNNFISTPLDKCYLSKRPKELSALPVQFKRKLHKISLAHLNRC